MIFLETPDNFENAVSVVGCFLEHDGKILLLLRNSNKSGGDTWGAPGGKVDREDMTNESALAREIFEETGIKIDTEKLKKTGVYYVIHPPEKKFVYTKYRYVLDKNYSVILCADEHKDFVWVTPQEALQLSLVLDEGFTIQQAYGIE